MAKLNQKDYNLKLIKDLGMVRTNPNSVQPYRMALWECGECHTEFSASVSNVKTGKTTKCSPCGKQARRKYFTEEAKKDALKRGAERNKRTKRGLLGLLYTSQKGKSKKRKHPLPNYSIEEFLEFAYSMPEFHRLHKEWVSSGYETDLRPSFDRIDSLKPYTLDNLQLLTWYENNAKGRSERNKHKTFLGIVLKNKKVLDTIQKEFAHDVRITLLLKDME